MRLATDKVKVMLSLQFDVDELWQRVMGAGWESCPGWLAYDFVGGDWDKACILEVAAEDPDDDDAAVTAYITVLDVVNALEELSLEDHWVVGDFVNENLDAMSSDAIMQQAVFGDIVYG